MISSRGLPTLLYHSLFSSSRIPSASAQWGTVFRRLGSDSTDHRCWGRKGIATFLLVGIVHHQTTLRYEEINEKGILGLCSVMYQARYQAKWQCYHPIANGLITQISVHHLYLLVLIEEDCLTRVLKAFSRKGRAWEQWKGVCALVLRLSRKRKVSPEIEFQRCSGGRNVAMT